MLPNAPPRHIYTQHLQIVMTKLNPQSFSLKKMGVNDSPVKIKENSWNIVEQYSTYTSVLPKF